MSSVYGKNIKVSIFGQSHSRAIGVTIDGLPAGLTVDFDELQSFLQRRAPGTNNYSTKRRESDIPEFLCGIVDGVTCGAPITAVIHNSDARSGDYDKLRDVPRPSHSDYTAYLKYAEYHDIRGGGHFSGRLTAPLCVAGGIMLQALHGHGIEIRAHIASIGAIKDELFDPVGVSEYDFRKIGKFPVLSALQGERMLELIETVRAEGDSIGGVIECCALNVPGGFGDGMFGGVENRLSSAIFGIPGVRGIEFGSGFESSKTRGSYNNDAFYYDGDTVKTRTNNHGGILGGITSGMPLIFRAAIKPTPSISQEQDSISLGERKNVKLSVSGRHDPCIVPRAAACVEAVTAIAVYDILQDSATLKE